MSGSGPDDAMVLRVKPLGEKPGGLAVLFCREHGVVRGMVTLPKKDQAMVCAGNLVRVERWRRLESQLGKLTLEPVWNAGALVLSDDRTGVLLVAWLAELLEVLLPEEHGYPLVWAAAVRLVKNWEAGRDRPETGRMVAEFEKLLLGEVGYGLALANDPVVDGAGERLRWVSPNSGRAVGEMAGAAYEDKLLDLPDFWGGEGEKGGDVAKALRITGHFLAQAAHGRRLEARERLVKMVG